jgi:hypothetical protein
MIWKDKGSNRTKHLEPSFCSTVLMSTVYCLLLMELSEMRLLISSSENTGHCLLWSPDYTTKARLATNGQREDRSLMYLTLDRLPVCDLAFFSQVCIYAIHQPSAASGGDTVGMYVEGHSSPQLITFTKNYWST